MREVLDFITAIHVAGFVRSISGIATARRVSTHLARKGRGGGRELGRPRVGSESDERTPTALPSLSSLGRLQSLPRASSSYSQEKAAVMVKSNLSAEVVYDLSNSRTIKSRSLSYADERRNFMSGNLADMYRKPISKESVDQSDSENEKMDIGKILKDVEYLGASNMSWKERKQHENRKVVSLGGKPPKKHRTPLSVAKPAMKNQKRREQKKKEEELILGRFALKSNSKARKPKPEGRRGLKASEGHFRKGVLNVKHLLAPTTSQSTSTFDNKKGKKKVTGLQEAVHHLKLYVHVGITRI
ncbi:hypothetical protein OPV22_024238 [Ensete ventricosum]|uniref:DUF3741 domain-containing protein n=1 Tax=Ensete ventricosum TaxID=4639 RepID=A0AAV8PG54_ENSVE|nr:hypothetical protein OPV22_024238 [Ensete ventricosum]